MADERHVSRLLAEVFRRGGMKRSLRRAEAVLLWPKVAGEHLAGFTRARRLEGGVLFIDVPDSETAMHLTLQRNRFLDAFRERYQVRDVREIRFQPGRAAAPPAATEQRPPPATVDPRDLARLNRALGELDLPNELSGSALEAGRAMLRLRARRLAEGWSACPACQALSPDPGLCPTCRRHAGEPRVRRAAGRLAMHPLASTPHLSDEERAVAARLAGEELEGTMNELLPQVLADQDLRPQLAAAARCFLALRLGKAPSELSDADMLTLPARIARVLGHLG